MTDDQSADEALGRHLADRLGDRADALDVEEGLRQVHAAVVDRAAGPSRSRFIVPVAAALALIAGVVGAITLTSDTTDDRTSLETTAVTEVTLMPENGDSADVVEFAILMDPNAPAGDLEAVQALLEQLNPDGDSAALDDSARHEFAGSIDSAGGVLDLSKIGSIYRLQVPDDADIGDLVLRLETLPGVGSVESTEPSGDDGSTEIPEDQVVSAPVCAPVAVDFDDHDDELATVVREAGATIPLTADLSLHRGPTPADYDVSWHFPEDVDDECSIWSLRNDQISHEELIETIDDVGLTLAPRGFSITHLLRPPDDDLDDRQLKFDSEMQVVTVPAPMGQEGRSQAVLGWHFADGPGGELLAATLTDDRRHVCAAHQFPADESRSWSCITTLELALRGGHFNINRRDDEADVLAGVVVNEVVAVTDGIDTIPTDDGFFIISSAPGVPLEFILDDGTLMASDVLDGGRVAAEAAVTMSESGESGRLQASCARSDLGVHARVLNPPDEWAIWIGPATITIERGLVSVLSADVTVTVADGITTVRAMWTEDGVEGEARIVCNDHYIDARSPFDETGDE